MTALTIRMAGDPVLRQQATRIRRVDDGIRTLADAMWETLHIADGVAIAAPQVGISRRLVVIHMPAGYDAKHDPDYRFRLADPEIVKRAGEQVGPEGCLSLPGWWGDVRRSASIIVKAIDMQNRPVRIKATGQLAVCLQHEIDHLDGIMFTDRMDPGSRLHRDQ